MVEQAKTWVQTYWLPLLVCFSTGLCSGGLGAFMAVQALEISQATQDEQIKTLDSDVEELRRKQGKIEAQVVENRLDLARITGPDRP